MAASATIAMEPTARALTLHAAPFFGGLNGEVKRTFRLAYDGEATSAIDFGVSAAAVQGLLEGVSTIGTGNVLVTDPGIDQISGLATGYTITFTGALANRNIENLFVVSDLRPDGADLIYGGAGTPEHLARNDLGGVAEFALIDVDAGTDRISINGTAFAGGETVRYAKPVATESTAVGGLVTGTRYVVINVTAGPNPGTQTFQLATLASPTVAINLSAPTGTGLHSLTEVGAHARDADVIVGDNANVYRLVNATATTFLGFNYDTYSDGLTTGVTQRDISRYDILPRAVLEVDYAYDVLDTLVFNNTRYESQFSPFAIGAGDLIYGEGGDDIIHGMTGDDALFGNSEDDDLYGEQLTNRYLNGILDTKAGSCTTLPLLYLVLAQRQRSVRRAAVWDCCAQPTADEPQAQ